MMLGGFALLSRNDHKKGRSRAICIILLTSNALALIDGECKLRPPFDFGRMRVSNAILVHGLPYQRNEPFREINLPANFFGNGKTNAEYHNLDDAKVLIRGVACPNQPPVQQQ